MLSIVCDIITSDAEVTLIKFLGYLLLILWPAYLIKEIFLHRPDPLMASLTDAVRQLSSTSATLASQQKSTETRIEELRQMQIRDTEAIFRKIDDIFGNFQSALRDHDREIGKMDGQIRTLPGAAAKRG